jgi:hypothetical protein
MSRKIDSPEAVDNYTRMVGVLVRKRSNKPFKSRNKVNRVLSVVTHEETGLLGFKFDDDDSVVECWRCAPIDDETMR